MNHGHVHTALHQTVGGFQTQQSTANYHCTALAAGCLEHDLNVSDITETDHALFVVAGHRDDERAGSRANQ